MMKRLRFLLWRLPRMKSMEILLSERRFWKSVVIKSKFIVTWRKRTLFSTNWELSRSQTSSLPAIQWLKFSPKLFVTSAISSQLKQMWTSNRKKLLLSINCKQLRRSLSMKQLYLTVNSKRSSVISSVLTIHTYSCTSVYWRWTMRHCFTSINPYVDSREC